MFAKYRKVMIWSLASQVTAMLTSYLSVSLINKLFSKETYGEMVFFQSIFAYILILATLGFDKTIVYKLSHYSELKSKLFGKKLVSYTQKYSYLLLMLVEFLFISVWHLFIEKDFSNEWFWIVLFSINAFLSVTMTLYSAYFQANKFADTTMQIRLLNNTLKMFILVVLFLLNIDSLIYFVAYIIVPTSLSLIQYRVLDQRHRATQQESVQEPTKNDLSYSLKMMFTKLVHQGVEKIDLIMVGIFLSASFVAEYAVAAKLALLVLFGNNLLSPLLSPRLKFAIDNKSDKEVIYEYNYNKYIATGLGMLILLIFLFFGKLILSFFGEYEQSYSLLILLGLAFLNKVSFGPNGRYLMLCGLANITLLTTLLTLIFLIIFNVTLIPKLGVIGAAIGTLLSLFLLNVIIQILIQRYKGISFNSFGYYFILFSFNIVILTFTLNLT